MCSQLDATLSLGKPFGFFPPESGGRGEQQATNAQRRFVLHAAEALQITPAQRNFLHGHLACSLACFMLCCAVLSVVLQLVVGACRPQPAGTPNCRRHTRTLAAAVRIDPSNGAKGFVTPPAMADRSEQQVAWSLMGSTCLHVDSCQLAIPYSSRLDGTLRS
jgi:hypothetical protein